MIRFSHIGAVLCAALAVAYVTFARRPSRRTR